MDPSEYRPAAGEIPTSPGVYRFRDEDRRILYVGKAKNLRQRLNSYFADPAGLHPRTFRMVHSAASVEWTVVSTEVEALQLEWTWIREFSPRFNVMFRDDKSYPYLAITSKDRIPRVFVTRGKRKKGITYFGPFGQAWAIRESLDLLLQVFPVRTCTTGVLQRAQRSGRPCLLGYIDKCSAPCVGRVSEDEHRDLVRGIADFMSGSTGTLISDRKRAMARAAEELDYERAARLRDEIQALEKVLDKNAVVLSMNADCDVFAVHYDELEAAVQVFHVRGGRIRGQRGWTAEILDDSTAPDLIERALTTLYSEGDAPKEVLVPVMPTNRAQLQELMGRRVDLRVPQRGEKKDLLRTVSDNATEALRLHRLKRTGDLTARTKALEDLGEALDLAEPPLRIECFDISHSHGTNVVGSQVVFEDGLPRKSEYRRYSVTGAAARDDTASMHDVLTRRLKHHLDPPPPVEDEDGRPRRFAYPPSLILVDGGPPQVAAAQRAMDELGITDIALAGIAKRLEEIWLPGEEYPVILPRTSEALFLVQRLRDEAHRFAITYHRSKRGRAMQASALDGIPGLGPARRRALLDRFVTVSAIREASEEELTEVDGIGPALAGQITAALTSAQENGADPDTAEDALGVTVDMATGEILEG